MAKRGAFFVFEGIDGAGKTVQLERLATNLRERGHDVIVTQEPTDGYYESEINRLLTEGREDVSIDRETQLFTEDRRYHVNEVIQPALEEGKVVICDRYYFSTMAYQGAAGGNVEGIRRMNEEFAPVPDRVFLLQLPVNTAMERIRTNRKDGFSAFEKGEYLEKVDALFQSFPDDCILRLSGTGSPDDLGDTILTEALRVLESA